MVALILVCAVKLLLIAILHHIELTANDGLEVVFLGLIVKVKDPEHIAVVSDSHGFLPVIFGLFHHLLNGRSPIEQRVLGMAV